jgi:hypothetical protein
MAADIEQALLQQLADSADGSIADSGDFATAVGQDHLKVVGIIKSLEAAEMIAVEVGLLQAACKTVTMGCSIQQQQPTRSAGVPLTAGLQ